MSLKRQRTTSYGDYNQVSQSQNSGGMYRTYLKGSSKVPKKKPYKKISKSDIDRAISRRLENKIYVDYGANQTIIPAAAVVTPVSKYMLPVLAQGLGQGARIGNRVHIRSGKLCIFINPNADSLSTINSPLMVRIWLVSFKEINNNLAPEFNGWFQTGNSTVGFQKTIMDMILPVNRDQYTVYFDQTYKIGYGGGLSNTAPNKNNVDNSSFNQRINIDWGQYFKSELDFNDTDNVAQNRNLHLVFQCVRADGGTILSEADSGAEFHFTNTVKYEDG